VERNRVERRTTIPEPQCDRCIVQKIKQDYRDAASCSTAGSGGAPNRGVERNRGHPTRLTSTGTGVIVLASLVVKSLITESKPLFKYINLYNTKTTTLLQILMCSPQAASALQNTAFCFYRPSAPPSERWRGKRSIHENDAILNKTKKKRAIQRGVKGKGEKKKRKPGDQKDKTTR
jgi:hypothetical protein